MVYAGTKLLKIACLPRSSTLEKSVRSHCLTQRENNGASEHYAYCSWKNMGLYPKFYGRNLVKIRFKYDYDSIAPNSTLNQMPPELFLVRYAVSTQELLQFRLKSKSTVYLTILQVYKNTSLIKEDAKHDSHDQKSHLSSDSAGIAVLDAVVMEVKHVTDVVVVVFPFVCCGWRC